MWNEIPIVIKSGGVQGTVTGIPVWIVNIEGWSLYVYSNSELNDTLITWRFHSQWFSENDCSY